MTVTTPKIPEFVPDEALLAYIDGLPGEVIRWGAADESTEFYPMVRVEVRPDPPAEYIEIKMTLPDGD